MKYCNPDTCSECLYIKMKVSLIPGPVKIMQNTKAVCRVQFHAPGAKGSKAGSQFGSNADKISAGVLDVPFIDRHSDIFLLNDSIGPGCLVDEHFVTRTFLTPTDQTIAEFLLDFVSLYGEKRWGVSMYDSQNSLISNYINPIIGDLKVQEVTPRVVDKYIQTLQKTPAVSTKMHKAKTQYVTNQTIEKIIKLLRCAFKQAVRWELIAKNPFDNVILPNIPPLLSHRSQSAAAFDGYALDTDRGDASKKYT